MKLNIKTNGLRTLAALLLPWLVLATGLYITYFSQQVALSAIQQAQQNDFASEVRETTFRIGQRLATYRQILRGISGLFAASPQVGRDEFRIYIDDLRLSKSYPGIEGIGFAVIIPHQEKAKHIDAVRKQGFPDYTVFPEGKRGFYTPVIYLEPFNGRNVRTFGFDMYSEPVRRVAMEQARDLDGTIITGKVTLVQDSAQLQAGFLMVLPIYRNGSLRQTLAERRSNIIGWVYVPFRMNNLMQGILSEHSKDIDLEIFDGDQPTPATLMYGWHNGQQSPAPPSLYQASQRIDVFGHPWTIVLRSLADFEMGRNTGNVTVVRVTGTVMSVLLALLIWQLIGGRAQAVKLAKQMTIELQQSESRAKTALAELEYQKYMLDRHLIVATTDVGGTINYANDKFCQISGYTRQELIGQNHRLMKSGTHPAEFFAGMFRTIASGRVWQGEMCNRAKDGSLYWLLTTIVPFVDETGKPSLYVALRSDITGLKSAEAKLKDALNEKEALLKEVYHRVKNNLQVVSSLINLQAGNVKNEEAVELLRQSANRIKAMALLHEKLYQAKDLAKIDFNVYIQSLIDYLLFSYGVPSGEIKVNMNIDRLFLDIDMAIPCGLIVNELVSNAIKHGFPGGMQGEIGITFTQDKDRYVLVIRDNGIRFPDSVDIDNSQSLGLQLVATLAHQLMGDMTLDRTGGATFTLRFNA